MALDSNAKVSDIITGLQDIQGINQKHELQSALVNKGIDATENDSMAEMVNKLDTANLVLDGKKWASGQLPPQTIRLGDPEKIILDTSLEFDIGLVIVRVANQNFYCAYMYSLSGAVSWVRSSSTGWFTGYQTGIYAIEPSPENRLTIATRGGSSGANVSEYKDITWIAFEN